MKLTKNRLIILSLGLVVIAATSIYCILYPIAGIHNLYPIKIPQKFKSLDFPATAPKQDLQVKRTTLTKNSIKFANAFLKNELFVNSRWSSYKIPKELTWRENPFNNLTWCVYFHSLDIVGHLANAYEVDPNPEYLKKAKWIIESWHKANPSPFHQASKYAWYDMIAANRVMNILHFQQVYENTNDPEFKKTMDKILIKHGDFLANNFYYSSEGNHGMFQDKSLIYLSLLHREYPNSKNWLLMSLNRLFMHISNEITPSGVHKEHSPSYHLIVLKLLESVDQILQANEIHVQELDSIIENMQTYLAYVTKPDGTLPNVGDSEPTQANYTSKQPVSNPFLLFSQSDGKLGIPLEPFKVYQDAGVAFFRNLKSSQDMYCMFTAGFHTNIHKHADDLSFILTVGKTDFFVDTGKYNYEMNDPWREYFRSALAHNTLLIDDKSYSLLPKNAHKSRIENFQTHDKYDFVTASHDLFPGVHIQRTILWLKTGSFLIYDQIQSHSKHHYSQIFQIGNDVEIQQNENEFTLKSKIENLSLQMIQNSDSKVQFMRGESNKIQGWISNRWMTKDPLTSIKFTLKNEPNEFKTIINTSIKNPVISFNIEEKNGEKIFLVRHKNDEISSINISH